MSTTSFLEARDLLLGCRGDSARAREAFRWPRPATFNWALDVLDVVPPRERAALVIVGAAGELDRRTFGELTDRSARVANWLRGLGVRRGDRVMLMLPNVVPLWEAMVAAMKLGAVVIPASTLLPAEDVRDRVERGEVRAVIALTELAERFEGVPERVLRVAVGTAPEGWHDFAEAATASPVFEPDGPTRPDDPLLLYFTSGTTQQPKLVEHTHASYPLGHLTTMYWIGLRPGDIHLNVSSPGWAKHAWSCVFAPWNAEATVLVVDQPRFHAADLLDAVVRAGATTMCAPPTVWRMLVQEDLRAFDVQLREVVGAGEPLNPEVIEQVQAAWGLTIRDGYGQTETTLQVGNFPDEPVRIGSMGRPAPGYRVELLDAEGAPADEGEICLDLAERPLALMTGYLDDEQRSAEAMRDGYYHTGDVAVRDADGYLTYVGRTDDVFKAADYRISPFELESVLIEHEAVAEAAVVASPDPIRGAVPKAFVVLSAGREPDEALAASILGHCRERLAPYKRIRRLEFAELPKTISGKIRRVELRAAEHRRTPDAPRNPGEWWEEDLAARP